MAEQKSYLYAGLAGETGPGRPVDSGLFRLADGHNEWEALTAAARQAVGARLGGAPGQSRDHLRRDAGGPLPHRRPWRHWEKAELPDHGLPVFDLFHPHNPDVILVGSESSKSTAATMPASIGSGCRSALRTGHHHRAWRQPRPSAS